MKCSRCEKEHNRNHRYCRACHAEYMRSWRPKHNELTADQRKRANCRSYSNTYKKRGIITQQDCEHCGSKSSQMHHDDYSKPLEVKWLCRACHLNLHAHKWGDIYRERA